MPAGSRAATQAPNATQAPAPLARRLTVRTTRAEIRSYLRVHDSLAQCERRGQRCEMAGTGTDGQRRPRMGPHQLLRAGDWGLGVVIAPHERDRTHDRCALVLVVLGQGLYEDLPHDTRRGPVVRGTVPLASRFDPLVAHDSPPVQPARYPESERGLRPVRAPDQFRNAAQDERSDFSRSGGGELHTHPPAEGMPEDHDLRG